MGLKAGSNKVQKKDKNNKKDKYNVHLPGMQEITLSEKGKKDGKIEIRIKWLKKRNFTGLKFP